MLEPYWGILALGRFCTDQLRLVRTGMTSGQYSPVRPLRSVSKKLIITSTATNQRREFSIISDAVILSPAVLIIKKLQWCWKVTIMGAGHSPSSFVPTPGHLDTLCAPPRGICTFFNANAQGLAQEGGVGHCWNRLMQCNI